MTRFWISFIFLMTSLEMKSRAQPSPPLDNSFDSPLLHIKPDDVVNWQPMGLERGKDGLIWELGVRLLTKNNFTLYRDKVDFILPPELSLISIKTPPLKEIIDPLTGSPAFVYTSGDFFLRLAGRPNFNHHHLFHFSIKFLACTESICLLPHTTEFKIPTTAAHAPEQKTALSETKKRDHTTTGQPPFLDFSSRSLTSSDGQQQIAEEIKKGELNLAVLLLLLFLGGLATNLTPCVFPMIPITLRLLSRHTIPLVGSSFYALGITISYTALGMIVALSGGMFGSLLANSAFNIIFASVFVILALTMLGFGNVSYLQQLGSKIGGRSPTPLSTIGTGMAAALVAAPCTGPILGALIAFVAKSEEPHLAPLLFLSYSTGFAIPYLFLGLTANKLMSWKISPKLQVGTKNLFSAVMFALSFYYLKIPLYSYLDFFSGYWWMMAGLGITLGMITTLVVLSPTTIGNKWHHILPTLILGFGFFSGIQALSGSDQKAKIKWLSSLDEAKIQAVKANKPLLIDGWAEWCVACKQMDSTTYQNEEVIREIETHWIAVKLDFTAMSEVDTQIGERWGITGLPTTIIVSSHGNPEQAIRLSGYLSGKRLLQELHNFRND